MSAAGGDSRTSICRQPTAPRADQQVATIRRIFQEFNRSRGAQDIAEELNHQGITSPGGGAWDGAKVRRILVNELYVGTLVYNKTTQKLKTPTRHNPKGEW